MSSVKAYKHTRFKREGISVVWSANYDCHIYRVADTFEQAKAELVGLLEEMLEAVKAVQ